MPPSDDQPILNVVGQKVALGPLRRDLLPLYQRWINDFEVTRTLLIGPRSITAEAEAAWFDQAASNAQEVTFTIYERASLRPIGNTGLHQIDHLHRIR
jgi:RimJ/RimL family protein N-acetyltransferase